MRRLESLRRRLRDLPFGRDAAEHLHDMLSGEQGIDEAIETCAQRSG